MWRLCHVFCWDDVLRRWRAQFLKYIKTLFSACLPPLLFFGLSGPTKSLLKQKPSLLALKKLKRYAHFPSQPRMLCSWHFMARGVSESWSRDQLGKWLHWGIKRLLWRVFIQGIIINGDFSIRWFFQESNQDDSLQFTSRKTAGFKINAKQKTLAKPDFC